MKQQIKKKTFKNVDLKRKEIKFDTKRKEKSNNKG